MLISILVSIRCPACSPSNKALVHYVALTSHRWKPSHGPTAIESAATRTSYGDEREIYIARPSRNRTITLFPQVASRSS
jgi:hypothetical protein